MSLKIYRGDAAIAEIPNVNNIKFTHGLMGAHKIVVSGVSNYEPLPIQFGDYIIYKGTNFKINTVPSLKMDYQYSYDLTFEGPKYTWHDKLFLDEGEADFNYYGNALLLMKLFLANINEIDPGWQLGKIDETEKKHLPFANVTCHEAIILIAETFKLEFEDQNKTISMMAKVGSDTSLTFEYGMNKGLRELTRNYVNDKNVVTKVYGFGGTRNLPVGYRGAKKRIIFEAGFQTSNTELYGVREGQYTNDEIYPQRVAIVEAANTVSDATTSFTVKDSTIDFNLKTATIQGLEPKISFSTGDLSGEEFVITDYNPSTKVITYKGFLNSNNIKLPSVTFHAKAGDEYTLYDMEMPASYVSASEQQVAKETTAYVLENSVPKVEYGGNLDPIYLRDNQIDLKPGDRIIFKDAKIGLNDSIRITEITYPIDFPEFIGNDTSIDVTISNFVTYTAQQRLRDAKLIERHEVKALDIRSIEQARRNNYNLMELKDAVIDPNGNYFSDKIKPRSIETLYLAVGAVATNFNLNGVSFNPNHMGDANWFTATAGQLIHYDLKIEGSGYIWQMQSYSMTDLVANAKYFIYAKISKTSLVGSWELSTDVKTAESTPGYYILQAGVLFPVVNGHRDNAITKGMVFIIGDQITAGKMQSIDKQMFIDLTLGQLKLGDGDSGMDWNVTNPGKLTIRGGLVQNSGGFIAPLAVYRGQYTLGVLYYKGDTVTYNGSIWRFIGDTPVRGSTPAEGANWTLEIKRGDDGKYTEFRFAKNGSSTVPPPVLDATVDSPSGWSMSQPTLSTLEYAWIISTQKTAAGTLMANWSTPVRFNGADGAKGDTGVPGANGIPGPFLSYTGEYNKKNKEDVIKTYVGSETRIQGVKYLGNYYVTRTDAGSFSNILPTDTSKWNPFGGQFESLATGLLLAELAYIENLGVENLRTAESGRRLEILGEANSATFYDADNRDLAAIKDNVATYKDDDGGSTTRPLAGLTLRKYYSSNPSNPDTVNITGNGIYSNTGFAEASIDNLGGFNTVFASVIGYVRRAVNLVTGSFQAGIAGLANTTNSVGGYFKHLSGGTALYVDGFSFTKGNATVDGGLNVNGYLQIGNSCIFNGSIISNSANVKFNNLPSASSIGFGESKATLQIITSGPNAGRMCT